MSDAMSTRVERAQEARSDTIVVLRLMRGVGLVEFGAGLLGAALDPQRASFGGALATIGGLTLFGTTLALNTARADPVTVPDDDTFTD